MASKVYDPEQRKRMITGPQWWARCKQMNVLDSFINYYDSEKHAENAVIFLHGNAASSYLWRHVVPHIEPVARCIIPDLIGMGKSGKSGNGSYRLLDHYKYLTAWFELLNLPKKIIFVGHDWGACLAFHYSYEHQDKIKAIVHAESVVDVIESWDEWPDIEEDIALIKSEEGEKMVLENNFFVETMLPSKIMRKLEPEEFAAYLEPFKEKGEVRRPTLSWPREIPLVKGGKPDVVQIVRNYNAYLRASDDLPKMFIESDPGFFSNAIVEGAKKFPNTEFVKVKGLHFSQEDAPDEMGKYIKSFVERVLKNEQTGGGSGGGGSGGGGSGGMTEYKPTVRLATRDDVPRAVRTLAAAFADYPATRHTVDPDRHIERVTELQELFLTRVGLDIGKVWVADDGAAVAVWTTPESVEAGAVFAEIGPRMAELSGSRLAAQQQMEGLLAPHRPKEPAWFLATVGVSPDHQGKGLGSAVVLPGVEAAERAGVPAFLETSAPRNLPFYERLGFTVTADVEVPEGPRTWCMTRKPGA
nr:Renilla luciferase-puromycin acetyltransferase fusion protein [Cloning vector pCRm-Rluc-PAC]